MLAAISDPQKTSVETRGVDGAGALNSLGVSVRQSVRPMQAADTTLGQSGAALLICLTWIIGLAHQSRRISDLCRKIDESAALIDKRSDELDRSIGGSLK